MTTLQESTSEVSVAQQLPTSRAPNGVEDDAMDEPAEEPVALTVRHRPLRAFQDGVRFGKYQIVHLIAIGGMSEVYEAIHLGLQKHVALKVMRPDLAENTEARRRFVSEGIHAARIRHTNVVDVSDVGVVDDLPYLVMELLVGEDLGMVYDRQKALSVSDLVDILLPVSFAVAEGHAKGVVHRDLKPENIFMHREGRRVIPKVLDFGVSRILSARRITLNASVFGTPHYMAPEQARGDATDERTDQYSLGVMLYEGVTGKLPRDSPNALQLLHSVANEPFPPPSTHKEDVPPEFEAIILRAMAREPEGRFLSMHDLAVSLVPFASESARESWEFELGVLSREDDASGEVQLPIATRYASSPEILRMSEPPSIRNQRRPSGAHHGQDQRASAAPEVTGSPVPKTPASDVQHVQPAKVVQPGAGGMWSKPSVRAVAATALVLVLCGEAWWALRDRTTIREPRATPVLTQQRAGLGDAASYDVEVHASPEHATVTLDGRPVGFGHFQARLQKDGTQHELAVEAAGYAGQSVRFLDAPPPGQLALVSLGAQPQNAAPAPVWQAQAQAPAHEGAPPEPEARPQTQDRAATSRRAKYGKAGATGVKGRYARVDDWPGGSPELAALPDALREAPIPQQAAVPAPTLDRESLNDEGRRSQEPRRPRVRVIDGREPRVRLVD
ncbi:MAG: hypothetical protein RL701_5615 [Pseudomonadota bacterium]